MSALGSPTQPLATDGPEPAQPCADDALLTVTVTPKGKSARLHLEGQLDVATVTTLRTCLDQLDPAFRTVLVDLGEVSFIDSTGLGAFVAARRSFEMSSRALLFCNPSERSRFIFELTGLGDLITN